jgi:hypothetical protein
VYIVYSDAARTTIDTSYSYEMEIWKSVNLLGETISDQVWDELVADHLNAGSTGEALSRIPVNPASARERVVQGYAANAGTGLFTGVLWLEVDGQLVTTVTSCSVSFYSDTGGLLFTETDLAPDTQGVFRITRPNPGFTADQLIYAVASITTPTATIVTVKAITAVS